jgi:hypothetical protein
VLKTKGFVSTVRRNIMKSDIIKIIEIDEHEDGSATLQVECDPETFAAIFNVGFVSLIKTGLYWETDND